MGLQTLEAVYFKFLAVTCKERGQITMIAGLYCRYKTIINTIYVGKILPLTGDLRVDFDNIYLSYKNTHPYITTAKNVALLIT